MNEDRAFLIGFSYKSGTVMKAWSGITMADTRGYVTDVRLVHAQNFDSACTTLRTVIPTACLFENKTL